MSKTGYYDTIWTIISSVFMLGTMHADIYPMQKQVCEPNSLKQNKTSMRSPSLSNWCCLQPALENLQDR